MYNDNKEFYMRKIADILIKHNFKDRDIIAVSLQVLGNEKTSKLFLDYLEENKDKEIEVSKCLEKVVEFERQVRSEDPEYDEYAKSKGHFVSKSDDEHLFKDYENNLAKNFEFYLIDAEKDDIKAQENLANCYERGFGTEKNYEKAIVWYEKAAKQGSEIAKFSLSAIYQIGLGTAKDIDKAVSLLLELAIRSEKSGDFVSSSQLSLAKIYEREFNDLDESVYWYGRAIKNGNWGAYFDFRELSKTIDSSKLSSDSKRIIKIINDKEFQPRKCSDIDCLLEKELFSTNNSPVEILIVQLLCDSAEKTQKMIDYVTSQNNETGKHYIKIAESF